MLYVFDVWLDYDVMQKILNFEQPQEELIFR